MTAAAVETAAGATGKPDGADLTAGITDRRGLGEGRTEAEPGRSR